MSQEFLTYTPKGLARELSIDYRVVLRALKNGSLASINYGPRTRRIRMEAAARWVSDVGKSPIATNCR